MMNAEKKLKRVRAPNWEITEKKLLKELLAKYSNIIENKCTDTESNIRRSKAWQKIFLRFNEQNIRQRTLIELKQKRRMCKAKKKRNAHRMKLTRNSGDGGSLGSDEDQVNSLESEMDQDKADDASHEVNKVEITSPTHQSPAFENTFDQAAQIVRNATLLNEAVVKNMQEEHEAKLKQMTEMHEIKFKHIIEAHEWARKEHVLKLKVLEQKLLSSNK